MSAQDLAVAQQEPSDSSAATLSDDDLLDALNRERAARQRAEQLYVERDETLAKLQVEMRDLGRLRDNFHSLYREERELRTEADRVAEERSLERDTLQQQVMLLQADVDRLDRMVSRYQAQAQRAEKPAATAQPAAAQPAPAAGDTRAPELERELGLLRAHAAELEAAVAERTASLGAANQRVTEMERELAMARTQTAGGEDGADAAVAAANRRVAELESELSALRTTHQALQSGRSEHAADLAAAVRRVHDLEGELATLRTEHADLRAAHERLSAARDALKQSLSGETGQREEAQRFAASAEQRVQEAVTREQEAVRSANQHRGAAEHAEQDLQAARATISVLEKRVHDAEAARAVAEQRSTELAEELSFVRSDVMAERPAPARRTLLRRRPAENGNGKHAAVGHVETVGTAIGVEKAVEVSGAPEDVETALHRRLFGGE